MESEPDLPVEVKHLLETSIRSIEELEILLRLRAAAAHLSARQLSDLLNVPEAITVTALQSLVMARLVVQVGEYSPLRYTFAPQRPELRDAAEKLCAFYEDNRIQVMMVISSNAIQRVRTGVLRMFSDSFGFSGPKKNG